MFRDLSVVFMTFIVIPLLGSWGESTTPCGACPREEDLTAFCELIRNPEKYDGHLVKVRATYRGFFEAEEVYCMSCRNKGRTWLAFDLEKMDKRSKALHKRIAMGSTVNATFEGVFRASGAPQDGYKFLFEVKRILNAEIIYDQPMDPSLLPSSVLKRVCQE
jgi:hypothetical protein